MIFRLKFGCTIKGHLLHCTNFGFIQIDKITYKIRKDMNMVN